VQILKLNLPERIPEYYYPSTRLVPYFVFTSVSMKHKKWELLALLLCL